MGKVRETHEPVRQSVHVDCPVEDAFRLFTERIDEWWPRNEPDLEDSEPGAVETGSVTVWDPPQRIEFTWHPGAPGDDRQTVTVDFRVEADGTRVTLIHHGWHHSGVARCASRFAQFVSEQMLIAA